MSAFLTADERVTLVFFGLLGAALLALLALIAVAGAALGIDVYDEDHPTPPNDGSDR